MSEKQEIKHKDLIIRSTTVEGVKDKYLTKISIPEGVKKISDNAFAGLFALEEIEFPASLVSIGEYAFSKCGSLKRVVVPESVAEIGEYAFSDCQQLREVDLASAQIRVLSEGTFRECRKLESLKLGSSLREIEASVFSYCQSLKSLCLPEGLLGVKDSFVGCEFDNVCIPNSLRYMETLSYRKVKSISISEDQYDRFKLVLPKPTEVKYNISFVIKCPVCGAVYTECKCKNNCSRIEVEGTTLIKARVWQSEFVVPDHITRVEDKAFYWNEDITVVTLPASVTEIGKEAFADCKKLEYVNLHKLVNLTSIGDSAFEFCRNLKLNEASFIPLTRLKSVGNCAFMETGIESVSFTHVDKVGHSAFAACAELESASFFKCCTEFGDDIFSECTNLEEVYLAENMTEIPRSMFNNCESLRSVQIPKNVTRINDYAFMNCSSLSEVCVLGPLKSLGKCAFAFCDSLGHDFQFEFMMWDSLEVIGESAFSGCTDLVHVEIPENVHTIGKEAFSCCEGIRYFFIPRSVTTVAEKAFPEGTIYGRKYDIELPYQPRGWDVELDDGPYSGVTVNWGYKKQY